MKRLRRIRVITMKWRREREGVVVLEKKRVLKLIFMVFEGFGEKERKKGLSRCLLIPHRIENFFPHPLSLFNPPKIQIYP
jgi:hypothetical protein